MQCSLTGGLRMHLQQRKCCLAKNGFTAIHTTEFAYPHLAKPVQTLVAMLCMSVIINRLCTSSTRARAGLSSLSLMCGHSLGGFASSSQSASRLQHWPKLAIPLQCQQARPIIAASNGLLTDPDIWHGGPICPLHSTSVIRQQQ